MAAFAALWLHERQAGRQAKAPSGEELMEFYEAREPGRGRLACSPPQIPSQGWKDVLWRTWHEVGRDRLPATAGGITFYALLAIFPAIGAFVSLYGLFADVDAVSRQLADLAVFVPASVLTLIAEQMIRLATARSEALSFAFVVGLLFSVWSANAGMAALFDGLNVVYGETEKRNFFARRLLTYAFTFAALVFVTLTTAILIAVPIALEALDLGETLLVPLRWLLLLGVATVAFAVVYRYGPSRELARWSWVWGGAAAASVAWVLGSLGFSWYVNNLANYDATYGPLGAVVAFMVWIWVSVMVLLLGAELNAELEHQTVKDTTTGAPLPLGQRGAAMADSVGPSSGGVRNQAGLAWAMVRRLAGRVRGPSAQRVRHG
jgi:membrane protein